MHKVVKDIINQLKPYNPEKIILFGSYAYGKPGEYSDIDEFIDFTKEKAYEAYQFAKEIIEFVKSKLDQK